MAAGEDWRGLLGQVVRAEAVVAGAEARFGAAEPLFASAVEIFRRHQVPFEEAETLHYWGRALVVAGDGGRAAEKLDAASQIYRRHGAGEQWVERVRADLPDAAGASPAAVIISSPPRTVAANGQSFAADEAQENKDLGPHGIFRREAEYWTLGCGGPELRLKDSKGLRYIAYLLRHPGQEFAVQTLVSEWNPEQRFLLPPAIDEFVGPGHLAYFVRELVRESLDLSVIVDSYKGERGNPPYHPVMMTALLLYAYCQGVYSSRRMAKGCEERVDFMAVTALNQPDFRTISDFRKRHLKALSGLFVQVLKLCMKAGLVKLGHVSLDGTKVKASASKHKAMSYARMKEQEPLLAAEVARWLKQAEEVDTAEDEEFGDERRGDEMPQWVANKQRRLEKIREAKAALEAEAGPRRKPSATKTSTQAAMAVARRPRLPPMRRSATSLTPTAAS